MDTANCTSPIKVPIQVSSITVKLKAKADYFTQMVTSILEIGAMTKLMDSASMSVLPRQFSKDTGRMMKGVAMARRAGLMELLFKVNTGTTRKTARANLDGQMATNM